MIKGDIEGRRYPSKDEKYIEELVKSVNNVDSIEGKISLCVMFIGVLEQKNGLPPGYYTPHVVMYKDNYSPPDPRIFDLSISPLLGKLFDIRLFLFLLNKSDSVVYIKLIDKM